MGPPAEKHLLAVPLPAPGCAPWEYKVTEPKTLVCLPCTPHRPLHSVPSPAMPSNTQVGGEGSDLARASDSAPCPAQERRNSRKSTQAFSMI